MKIKLQSGSYFDLQNPDEDQFTLCDIAFGLHNTMRWSGQFGRFSVLTHSVNCCLIAVKVLNVDNEIAFACLMHDAHEAFTNDITGPMKALVPQIRPVCDRIQGVINRKYAIEYSPIVKEVDNMAFNWERKYLLKDDCTDEWDPPYVEPPVVVDVKDNHSLSSFMFLAVHCLRF